MTRRIKKELREFFENQDIIKEDMYFINGCLRAQQRYPQLTSKQWARIEMLKEKYTNGESE